MNNKIAIEIPEPISEILPTRAAEEGVPVEELIEQMLKDYLERSAQNAD